ncbi:beta-ketoacyl synthase chain length factor [Aliidiomarina indica]|uniref:beta-ketoacyl synthase chain length factor n=1 Tax=Aliidiomarina indica TaxID=2749147 RepID=UPI00188DE272|nr:beta-ketoacyl synthase chain length factor [Aliidiomarina indica]
MNLTVQGWSAWTPHWSHPSMHGEAMLGKPDVSWVPANARRRLSSFTKMAFFVAKHASSLEKHETIFASRHGDLSKTLVQLQNLTKHEPLSPTQFALSVHNAVAGQYCIVTENQKSSLTLSAGIQSFDAALLTAYARLHADGELKEVVVVFADERIPEIYEGKGVTTEQSVALGLRVARHEGFEQGDVTLRIERSSVISSDVQCVSNVHNVLHFLEKNQMEVSYAGAGYNWRWQRT